MIFYTWQNGIRLVRMDQYEFGSQPVVLKNITFGSVQGLPILAKKGGNIFNSQFL